MAIDSPKIQSLEDHSFWKGIAAGFLAGIAVAAALRCTPLEKYISRLTTVEGKLDSKPPAFPELVPAKAEPLPVAGRLHSLSRQENTQPEQERVDHIDLSQPLRRYPRSFEMGSAG